jgi:hypothetical protein
MSLISDFIGRAISLLLRLALALAAAVVAISLLLAGMVAVVFMLLRALLTGRKPAPVMVWQRYRQASASRWTQRAASEGGHGRPRAAVADVVDVEARDIPPR